MAFDFQVAFVEPNRYLVLADWDGLTRLGLFLEISASYAESDLKTGIDVKFRILQGWSGSVGIYLGQVRWPGSEFRTRTDLKTQTRP